MILIQSDSRLVGYARVSTNEQELDLQTDALLQHGVKKELLFCDKISGRAIAPGRLRDIGQAGKFGESSVERL